jgi:hypothetical protein
MSFTLLRNNTRTWFNEVQVYLNFITQQEPNEPTQITPAEVKIMRGLFYVHLYSALEKTVNKSVEQTLLLIDSVNVKNKHFTLAFNTISVLSELKSLKDCGYKNFINKSIDLFQAVNSGRINTINETAFSNNLQNIWISTVNEIRGAFGMPDINITARMRATVDEIVDKRNAVAHGRETASDIGERHRSDILRTKLQLIQDFANLIIDDFEDYYDNKKFLKPIMKRHYI